MNALFSSSITNKSILHLTEYLLLCMRLSDHKSLLERLAYKTHLFSNNQIDLLELSLNFWRPLFSPVARPAVDFPVDDLQV